MLHLVALPPDNTKILSEALKRIDAGDDVVLLEQAQGFATSLEKFSPLSELIALSDTSAPINLFLLGDGEITPQLPIKRIDYLQLVALTEMHTASLSWYP